MRRNDVVYRKSDHVSLYGRVNRFIDADTVEWLCCGRHVNIDKVVDLEVIDYKGRWHHHRCYRRDRDGEIIVPVDTDGRELFSDVVPVFETMRFIPMPSLRRLKQLCSKYAGRNVWRVSKRVTVEND